MAKKTNPDIEESPAEATFNANYTRAEDVASLRVVAADIEAVPCVCAPGSITGRDGMLIVLVDGHAVLQAAA